MRQYVVTHLPNKTIASFFEEGYELRPNEVLVSEEDLQDYLEANSR